MVKPTFGGCVISPKAWEAPRTNGGSNREARRQGAVYNYAGSYPLETDTRIFRDCTKTGDISKINQSYEA